MKKSLLAVAAMTAFAGAAQAQSSVTVYGILDVGFSGTSTRGVASGYLNGTPVTDAQSNTKIQSNSFNSGNLATSRLGFKGTEDLGGGTSAFFTVEMGLNPTEASQFTGMVNRQSFAGLGKKGLGQASIGTQYTPIFNAMTATNPGANNTVVGSVIYPQTSTAATNSEALTVRRNNALVVKSDNFAGFTVQGMYFAANQDRSSNATTAPGNTNAYGFGLGADYTWKKLYVTAAYQNNKNETDQYATPFVSIGGTTAGATTTATTSQAAASTPSTAVANIADTQFYAGATYDFGILKAYASYVDRKLSNTLNSSQFLKRSGQQIGVRANLTPTITAWANIGNGRYDSFGTSNPSSNFNAWQLGSQYNMSKRTSLYAIYGQAITSSTTNASGLSASSAASQYAIGARHTF